MKKLVFLFLFSFPMYAYAVPKCQLLVSKVSITEGGQLESIDYYSAPIVITQAGIFGNPTSHEVISEAGAKFGSVKFWSKKVGATFTVRSFVEIKNQKLDVNLSFNENSEFITNGSVITVQELDHTVSYHSDIMCIPKHP